MNGTDLLERLEKDADNWALICEGEDTYSGGLMREAAALIRTLQEDKRRLEEALGKIAHGLAGCPAVHRKTEMQRIAIAALQPPISNEAGEP